MAIFIAFSVFPCRCMGEDQEKIEYINSFFNNLFNEEVRSYLSIIPESRMILAARNECKGLEITFLGYKLVTPWADIKKSYGSDDNIKVYQFKSGCLVSITNPSLGPMKSCMSGLNDSPLDMNIRNFDVNKTEYELLRDALYSKFKIYDYLPQEEEFRSLASNLMLKACYYSPVQKVLSIFAFEGKKVKGFQFSNQEFTQHELYIYLDDNEELKVNVMTIEKDKITQENIDSIILSVSKNPVDN